jgi:F0F1-type ATP synthase assembly protein I
MDDPKRREPDYDALLHRRKGMSGSEFAGVGLQFGLTIVLFAFAGIWLDDRLGTSPWFVLVMVFAGAGLGFWSMYRRVAGSGKPQAGAGKREAGK